MRPRHSVAWLASVALACGAPAQQAPATAPTAPVAAHPAVASRLRSLHLDGDAAALLRQAFALYGIQVVFLPPFNGTVSPGHVDLEDADLSSMAAVLGALTHTLLVPSGAHLVLAMTDNAENRLRYKRVATEAVAIPNLPGASPAERTSVEGLVTSVFGITNPVFHENSVTLHGPSEATYQAQATLATLYRPPAQVLLEVKAYTISRTHDRDAGIELPTKFTVFNVVSEAESLISSNESVVAELISSGLVSAGDTVAIALLLIAEGYAGSSVLGSSSLYFGGGYTTTGVQFDSANANSSLSVSSSQQLQQATLHLADGQQGILRIGEKYPVLTATTTYSGSSGSVTPSIQYVDLGLTLEATPRVVSGNEVSLHFHEIVRALHGSSIDNIPVLDNQELSSDVTIAAGASTVLVHNLSHTEALELQGLPVPTNFTRNEDDSQLLITVTPVITRRSDP